MLVKCKRNLANGQHREPGKRFTDLYSLLCNEVWLRVAVLHVQHNHGSETAGIDPDDDAQTSSETLMENIDTSQGNTQSQNI